MAKTNDPNDEKDENQDKPNDSEDNFGLPDIEYKPLAEQEGDQPKAEESEEPAASSSSEETKSTYQPGSYTYTPPEEKSKTPIVIGIVIAIVVVVAGFLIYQYVYKPAQEKARQEELARKKAQDDEAARKRAEQERLAAIEAENKRKADSIAAANAKPPEGAIQMLSEQTRRYYVVVSSAIDDDLVMDYAKKLSAKGVSTKIIPPFGKTKFFRLTIGDYETYAIAQNNADQAKDTYGPKVWVVRY